ncbi:MAG: DUF3996 domain-containing protein [Ignavibacteria bacterium]|nr:DUF3996 domain-containing protein [Ignavibacteria bacterium]
MKKIFFLALFAIALTSNFSNAQSKSGFGIGIIIGEPTGVSFKSWLDSKSAIDGAAAWSFVNNGSFHVHADYLRHSNLESTSGGELNFHYGIGGRLKAKSNNSSDDARIGARIPLGIDYNFASEPLELFLEVAPVLDFTPKTDFTFNGAIGIRYYLH